jgi:hypothetical protein
MPDEGLSLERWANFLVITSTAAATSIGLLFVVITLAADRRPGEVAKIRLYLTPTAVKLGVVLCLAAMLTFPDQSRSTATMCMVLTGAVGVLYSASLLIQGGRKKRERFYETSDVAMYVVCPAAAYALLVAGGVVLGDAVKRGLTLAAAGMLTLLALALRNSWAIVVDIVTKPHREATHEPKEQK